MFDLKMPDINTVLIAGNLTCDPSFRKTTNGTPVANFYIASNRKFKDNTGQWRENVCYVGVVAWYKLAESCYENLKRGNAIIVDGELQSRSWRNEDGTSRNVVEIKARRIQFLNRRYSQEFSRGDDFSISESDSSQESDSYGIEENDQASYQYSNNFNDDMEAEAEQNKTEEKPEDKKSDSDFSFGYENLKF
ncbi:single-stranded DNA-binding protein [candidate division KSB1 bacterium]|nr:single-stranded DNA-binding protein [candidate division KSB1 bacterium]